MMKHSETDNLEQDDHTQYIYRNPQNSSRNRILAAHYDAVPLNVKGALGQKANLLNLEDFYGNTLAHIDGDGNLKTPELDASSVTTQSLQAEEVRAWSASLEKLYTKDIAVDRINDIDVNKLRHDQQEHNSDARLHYPQETIDHRKIQNSGGYDHGQIDRHLDDTKLHYEEHQINHDNIKNSGSRTHSDIDKHIGNNHIHYRVDQIPHGSIQDLEKDQHPQYLLCNGMRPITNLRVKHDLHSQNIKAEKIESSQSLLNEVVTNDLESHDVVVKDKLKVQGEALIERLMANEVTGINITASALEVAGDVRVEGMMEVPQLQALEDNYALHLVNAEGQRHRIFNSTTRGFVPAPQCSSENVILTSCGKWKPLSVYLGFTYGEIPIHNPDTKWSFTEESFTIPYNATYEVHLHNVSQIEINGELCAKSKNLGSNTFLLQLQQGDTITGEQTSEIGSIYVKLLSYG